MNSFNHYSLGSIGEWLYTGVAGIDQTDDSVGWADLVVRPHPGGNLTRVSAEYDSVRGLVASSWRLDGDTFHLDVLVSPGATATVHIPTASPADVLESGAPVGSVGGVGDLRPGEGELACRLVSGRYSFTAAR